MLNEVPNLSAPEMKKGPFENTASTIEGIVFEHPPGSQQLYKLTGTFAMSNQLIGRAHGAKFKREKAESTVEEAVLRKYVRSRIGVMG